MISLERQEGPVPDTAVEWGSIFPQASHDALVALAQTSPNIVIEKVEYLDPDGDQQQKPVQEAVQQEDPEKDSDQESEEQHQGCQCSLCNRQTKVIENEFLIYYTQLYAML